MPSLFVNSCILQYTTVTNDNGLTLTITDFSRSSEITKYTSRRLYIAVDAKNVISVIEKQTPTEAKILSSMNHNGKATAEQKREAKVYRANQLQNNREDAFARFVNAFNTKKNNNQLKFTYAKKDIEQNVTLKLCLFGEVVQVVLKVPRNEITPTPGTREESKTIGIEKVNDGKNYVINEAAYAKYGHIERVVDFSDVEDEKQLLSLANIYVNNLQFDDISIKISAVDLHHLTGTIPSFELLDEIRCISRPHGLDRTFPLTEITIPLDDPSGVIYKLGRSGSTTMSQSTAANAVDLFKRMNSMPSPNRILDTAKVEMSNLLNNRTTGYVNIVQENDISQALVISNSADWRHATKLWKFDMNGLGYSDSTISNPGRYDNATTINADDRLYKIGMTMDGTIVADFIKTGLLEDGLGYNYWNLSTGEFRLSQNTILADMERLNGSVSTLDDLAAAIESTSSVVEEVYAKEVGSKNILRFSDDFRVLNHAIKRSWSDNAWITTCKSEAGTVTITDANATRITSSLPAPDLSKAVCLNYSRSIEGGLLTIQQQNIELKPDTIYTLACYCCGAGELYLAVNNKRNGVEYTVKKSVVVSHTDWRRYNMVFKVHKSDTDLQSLYNSAVSRLSTAKRERTRLYNIYKTAISSKESVDAIDQKKKAYSDAEEEVKNAQADVDILSNSIVLTNDNDINVWFGNSKLGLLAVSGLSLIQGNVSTDWEPSESDSFMYVRDLDSQLDARNLMFRLTGGNLEKQGVFLENGKLLLNAEYMVAGLIEDKNHYNKWNLRTGYIKTSNMEASNIKATGTLESTRIWMHGSPNLYFRSKIGWNGITFTEDRGFSNGQYSSINKGAISYYGITCPTNFDIAVGDIWVAPTASSYTSYRGFSGYINIVGMYQRSNKKVIKTTLARLCFLHGLLIGAGTYNDHYNKLRYAEEPWASNSGKRNMGKKNAKPKYLIGYNSSRSGFYRFYK